MLRDRLTYVYLCLLVLVRVCVLSYLVLGWLSCLSVCAVCLPSFLPPFFPLLSLLSFLVLSFSLSLLPSCLRANFMRLQNE